MSLTEQYGEGGGIIIDESNFVSSGSGGGDGEGIVIDESNFVSSGSVAEEGTIVDENIPFQSTYTPMSAQEMVDERKRNPDPKKFPEDPTFREYLSDIGTGLSYGVVEGGLQTYDTIREGAEGLAEWATGRELFDVEESVNTFDKPTTIGGNIASGIGQFVPGLVPGAGTVGLGITIGRTLLNVNRVLGIFKGTTVANLTGNLINFGTKAPKTASIIKSSLVAGAAEQYAFDPTDPRISDALEKTNIPVISSMASAVAQNPDDTELEARYKMLAEGLALGFVFDVALLGAKGLIAGVTRKPSLDKDVPTLTKEDMKQMELEGKLDATTAQGVAFINTVIVKELKAKGLNDSYIKKYVGSLNTEHLASSRMETYNLINETGYALEKMHGDKWQEVITNKQTQEDAAALLGHDNIDAMNAALTQSQGFLKLSKNPDGKGELVIGSGLQGLTSYAYAARQLLMNTNDLVFALASETKKLKPSDVPGKSSAEDIQKYQASKAAFMQQLLIYQNVQDTVNNIAGEAGRLLQSFNINAGNGLKPTFINDMIGSLGTDLDDVIAGISKRADGLGANASGKDRQKALFGDKASKSVLEKAKGAMGEYWYNSILSAPDTQLVNIAGNAGVQILRTFLEGTVGATRGTAKLWTSRAMGKDIDPGSVMLFGDVWARIKGMTYGQSQAGGLSRVALMGGKDNPVVMDKLILDVSAGKYGKGKTVEEVIGEVGWERLYSRTKDSIIDQHGASVSAFGKAVRLFGQAFKHEMPTEARYSKYEMTEASRGKAITTPVLGRLLRIPTTTMGAFDTAFKSLADNAALYESAYRELRSLKYRASKNKDNAVIMPDGKKATFNKDMFTLPGDGDGGNPNTFTAAEYVEHLVANPTASMDKYARDEFLQMTFQQEGLVTKAGEKVRKLLNEKLGRGVVPVGTMLMPFVRTPINLIAYSLDRTPLGIMAPEVTKARATIKKLSGIKNPSVSVRRQLNDASIEIEKMYNKQIVGMSYLTGAYYAASAGYITGAGPSDWAQRNKMEKELGWKPYSIRIGTTDENGKTKYEYYPISRLDPFSQIAALGADMQQLAGTLAEARMSPEDKNNAGARLYHIANGLAGSIPQMIVDKSYLKSLGEVAQTFMNPRDRETEFDLGGTLGTVATNVGGSVVGGLVPNVVSRVAEAFHDEKEGASYFYDHNIRELYAEADWLRRFIYKATSKVPGARKDLGMDAFMPKRNSFGQIISRDEMPFDKEDLAGRLLNAAGTISRPGSSPLTLEEQAMVYIEQKYRVRAIRVSKKFSPIPSASPKELNPALYDLRSQYQGHHYRNRLIALNKTPEFRELLIKAEEGKSGTAVKAVQEVISGIQAESRKVADDYLKKNHMDLINKWYKEADTTLFDQIVDKETSELSPAAADLDRWRNER